MTNKNFFCAAITAICLYASGAQSTVILDPDSEANYFFTWAGLGQINSIYAWDGVSTYPDWSVDLGNDWSITVDSDVYLDLATAWDGFLPGDEFAFYVDGHVQEWSRAYIDENDYFHGEMTDLFLSEGTHNFTFYAIEGSASGGAYSYFSAVSAVDVAEPGSVLLGVIGLLGLFWIRSQQPRVGIRR